jgi:hypothetical protein
MQGKKRGGILKHFNIISPDEIIGLILQLNQVGRADNIKAEGEDK